MATAKKPAGTPPKPKPKAKPQPAKKRAAKAVKPTAPRKARALDHTGAATAAIAAVKAVEPDKEELGLAAGRPSLYSDNMLTTANAVCAIMGGTDADLAVALGVSERTINRWKHAHPEFRRVITEGKLQADANVAVGLYKRATGYKFMDTDIRTVGVGKGESEIVQTPVEREMHPEPGAAQYWLNNRQPDHWKARTEVALEVPSLDLETAEARFAKVMREAHERQAAMRARRRKKGMDGE